MSDDEPLGLPEIPVAEKETPLDDRYCTQCGNEARIVSNRLGRTAYCGPCKIHWGISASVQSEVPMAEGRGLSKQIRVEPDWSLAFEEIDD
jgi:hypothetical protein